jgi:hypothetical protein
VDAFQSVAVVVGPGQQRQKSSRRIRIFHTTPQRTFLSSSTKDDDANDDADSSFSFRFLGRGRNAIVRPGCVLVAPSNEYHHFYRRAAIFIYGMGVDTERNSDAATTSDDDDADDDFLIRGLIIDFPTPFTLAEMMNHNARIVSNPLGNNFLFRGGDKGGDGVILLHNQKSPFKKRMEQALLEKGIYVYNDGEKEQEKAENSNEIGTSGIYQGGWDAALEACLAVATADETSSSSSVIDNYKAFFNYCEFTEKELEDMLDSRGSDPDNSNYDVWMSLEVEADFILNQTWDRGDAWKRLRKAVREQEEKQQQQQQQLAKSSDNGASASNGAVGTEDFS